MPLHRIRKRLRAGFDGRRGVLGVRLCPLAWFGQLPCDYLPRDRFLRIQRGQAPHQIFQLTDVSGPAMLPQLLQRALIQGLSGQAAAVRRFQEMRCEQRDILAPLPQRGRRIGTTLSR